MELFKSGMPIGQHNLGMLFDTTYNVIFRALIRNLGEDEACRLETIRNSNAIYKAKIKEKKSNVMPKQSKSKKLLWSAWI